MLLPETDKHRQSKCNDPAIAPGESDDSVEDCRHALLVSYPATEYLTRRASRVQLALDDLIEQSLDLGV